MTDTTINAIGFQFLGPQDKPLPTLILAATPGAADAFSAPPFDGSGAAETLSFPGDGVSALAARVPQDAPATAPALAVGVANGGLATTQLDRPDAQVLLRALTASTKGTAAQEAVALWVFRTNLLPA